MKWIKTIFREVFGLFVDDVSFAAAILIWLAVMRWVAPRMGVPERFAGAVLFAGLALIVGESVLRFARRKRAA
ncbi:MAG: hypothetical protein M3Y50_12730 [Acidobacteriota bacterium]|nr:hypothetical protein [Acidobacteriota bacterium]